MRALLDANVLISYLLAPADSPVVGVVEAGAAGAYTLLLPEGLAHELATRVRGKPWLAERIAPEEAAALLGALDEVAEALPAIRSEIPAVTRDPKDDYLLAYALVGAADYLVTGDRDLLVLGEVAGVRIVTPREFAGLLAGGTAGDVADASADLPPLDPRGPLGIE